ncbi:MAG: four helix bundle protein [Nitrospirae bacterium]|nr:four helix bundle protein [Nitrospirota bacterium]
MHNFKNLKIYQKAIEFSVSIYKLTNLFPEYELFGLTNQIRRAATSIALNIAEGSGNSSNKEFKRFLEISLRSNYEVIACLEIAQRLTYFKKEDSDNLITEANEIASMIVGFRKQL